MKRRFPENIAGKWLYFGAMGVMYFVVSIIDPYLGIELITKVISIFGQILPVFVVVFILMVLTRIFVDPERVLESVGEGSGSRGWLIAITGGIISAGPIYIWYPLLAELKEKGMKTSLVATFLYIRAVKIPLFPLMIYYFGLAFTLFFTLYLIIFSVINGVLVERLLK